MIEKELGFKGTSVNDQIYFANISSDRVLKKKEKNFIMRWVTKGLLKSIGVFL